MVDMTVLRTVLGKVADAADAVLVAPAVRARAPGRRTVPDSCRLPARNRRAVRCTRRERGAEEGGRKEGEGGGRGGETQRQTDR